ncbi:MAG: DUF465 domain-containing protein [Pseudomonadota bacterium]
MPDTVLEKPTGTAIPHGLEAEFPDDLEQFYLLRIADPRFAELADVYGDLNADIHRAETRHDLRTDVDMETMKKRRLVLLDEIRSYLTPH